MWQFQDTQVPPVQISMEDTLAEYRENLRMEEAEIALHTPGGRKRWKTKEGIYQLKHPEQGEQAEPTADDAIFAEMLGMCERHCGSDAGGTISLWRTSERL